MPYLRYITSEAVRFNDPADDEAEIIRATEEFIKMLSDPLTEEELYEGYYDLPEHPYYLYEGNSYVEAMAAYEGDLTRHDADGYIAAAEYTDGSPIQLPTHELVEEMLKGTSHDRDEVISEGTLYGGIGPSYDPVTVLNVAVNGVMAGCKPEYMPILLAITEAMCNTYIEEALAGAGGWFNVGVVISGPLGAEIGLNDGADGASGMTPGVVANTSIGRFIRLMMVNVGGTEPGDMEAKGLGSPLKTSVVLYESEQSPWPSLASTKPIGLEDGANTVTLFIGFSNILSTSEPFKGIPTGSTDPIADLIGKDVNNFKDLPRPQQGVLYILGVNYAKALAEAGYTREDVVHWISQNCVDTYEDAYAQGLGKSVIGTHFTIQGVPIYPSGNWPEEWSDPDFDPQTIVQWFPNEDSISIVVTGQRNAYMNSTPRWSVSVDPWK